jgi:hypothetical protein
MIAKLHHCRVMTWSRCRQIVAAIKPMSHIYACCVPEMECSLKLYYIHAKLEPAEMNTVSEGMLRR